MAKKATLPGVEVKKKPRKRRKPMSEEQKTKAAERLAAAREKRQKANPPTYANVHKSVNDMPDDYPLSRKNVMDWIKTNKEEMKEIKAAIRRKEKGAEAKLSSVSGYVRNMEKYLRDGDWPDMFYGKNQDKKVRNRCVALAYHWYGPNKGMPKRDVGTFYPDISCVWEESMYEQEGYNKLEPQERSPVKQKRRKKTVDGPSSKTDEVLRKNIKKRTK